MAEEVPTDGKIVPVRDQDDCFTGKIQMVKFSYKWIINNFSRPENVRKLYSPKFTTEDSDKSKWRIVLEPTGDEGGQKLYTFLLTLLSRETDATIRAHCRFFIIDAKRQKKIVNAIRIYTNCVNFEPGHTTCIKEDILINEANRLLSNDQLTILCEIGIVEDEAITTSVMLMNDIDVPNWQLHKNLGDILTTKMLSDFTLVAGEQEFHAHKMMLAARSPAFSAMFKHGMEEQKTHRVNITDIDPDVLEGMLRYIYTDELQNPDKIADRLLVAAEKYGLPGLSLMCQDALSDRLSLENAASTFILADFHKTSQLKNRAIYFITKYSKEVVKTEGFKLLIHPSNVLLLGELYVALSNTVEIE